MTASRSLARAARRLARGARAASIVVAAAACAVTATAACSRTKKAPDVAARVVSLTPSTTEAMYAIGAGALVVGRSRFCDYPPEVLAVPQVGGFVDPNLEAILALKPDLVIGARGPAGSDLATRLAAHGAATFFPSTESFDQIDDLLRGLGARTGHAADAVRVIDELRARESAVEKALAGKPRPRVVLVFGLEPIVVAGPSTFADEMLRRAGATNAIADGSGYPTLGIERILALDPDIVLNGAIAEAHGMERITSAAPGWRELRAVREGHVVPLHDEAILRPGPRVADGLVSMARAIHPEAAIP